MAETLGSHATVVLFGRVVEDLTIVQDKKKSARSGSGANAIARIYGYSFGGSYYEMAGPVLFAVHGNGDAVSKVEVPGPTASDDKFYKSLRCWSYDKSDATMRLDIDSGSFEQVLLSDDVDGGMGVSGARVSGARVSGARVSGARVSGARVSGARVSGARISGARLSGARGDASD